MTKAWRQLIIAAILILGISLLLRNAKADGLQDVAPYEFGKTPDGTKIYKAVHQGCELFIAENYKFQMNHGDAIAVSITTGRGCK